MCACRPLTGKEGQLAKGVALDIPDIWTCARRYDGKVCCRLGSVGDDNLSVFSVAEITMKITSAVPPMHLVPRTPNTAYTGLQGRAERAVDSPFRGSPAGNRCLPDILNLN